MPKYLETKCSTYGCTRIAKQTSNEPYCRQCQINLCKKKIRQKHKEYKEKVAQVEELGRQLSDVKIIQTIYNELINPRKHIWNEVLVRISSRVRDDIKNKMSATEYVYDPNDDIQPVFDNTNMFPDCQYSNIIFKLLLLMRNETIPITEKHKENNKIILDFKQQIC
jgi:hypothetical protein